MKVQDLFIYPVKSIGGIRLENGQALQRGFAYDRRWMLVDQQGRFITQRVYHQLALLQASINDQELLIYYKKDPAKRLSIPLNHTFTKEISTSIWNDQPDALHLSESIDSWFSEFLDMPCKLVFMSENGHRPIDTRYAQHNEQVSFADAFPYLLISEASLNDLNSRLDQPVPMNRFRPSIVVSGTEPFEEDNWKEIKIGTVTFQVAKPCARCILTTVDQNTGIKGKEPLATLSRYRNINGKVLFGQNLIALNEGIIALEDEVKVLSYK